MVPLRATGKVLPLEIPKDTPRGVDFIYFLFHQGKHILSEDSRYFQVKTNQMCLSCSGVQGHNAAASKACCSRNKYA